MKKNESLIDWRRAKPALIGLLVGIIIIILVVIFINKTGILIKFKLGG